MIKQRNIFGGIDHIDTENLNKKDKVKMSKKIKDVTEFRNAAKLTINTKPTNINMDAARLHFNLLAEELDEYWEAVNIAKHKDVNEGLVEVLDALVDLRYVLEGAVLEFGLQDYFDEAWNEVHRSNMSKFVNGEVLLDENGKVDKPETYSKPDLKSILNLEVKEDE